MRGAAAGRPGAPRRARRARRRRAHRDARQLDVYRRQHPVAAADGPWVRGEASRLYSDARLPEGDFLASIVQPVYLFVAHEGFGRREEKITDRVMYDDVNESFWDARLLREALLPRVPDGARAAPDRHAGYYAHVRGVLRSIGMPAVELAGITGHSLRAGAATDYLEMNLPESFVRTQCGWAGESLRIYHRPQERHRWSACRVFAAMQTAGF